MIKTIGFSFLLGIGIFFMLPNLPNIYLTLSVLIGYFLIFIYFSTIRLGLFCIIGFFYAWYMAHDYQAGWLPESLSGHKIQMVGVIADIPKIDSHKSSFMFAVEKATLDTKILPIKKVKLNWYQPRKFTKNKQQENIRNNASAKLKNEQIGHLQIGMRLNITAKLKSPHARYNRFGFDYEKWLMQHRVDATGYVVDRLPYIISQSSDTFYRKINQLKNNIKVNFLSNTKQFPLLNALLLGDRSHMNNHYWQVLQRTGTSHLLAISGLHLGLLALMVGLLFRRLCLWSNINFLEQNSLSLATVGAFLATLIYAGLVGFSVPTQRAMWMIAILAGLLLIGRSVRKLDALALVLLAVLIVDPFFVLSAGFWLSFSAVFWILFSAKRFGMTSHSGFGIKKIGYWLANLSRMQLILSVGMMPVLAGLGFGVSLIGFIANLIALPVVSFIVLPALFLSALFQAFSISNLLLTICDNTLNILWKILEILSELPHIWHILPEWNVLEVSILCLSIWILFNLTGYPLKWLSLLMVVALLYPNHAPIKPNMAKITMYDVGQGLAVGVQTHRHFLLFDTGRSGYFAPSVFTISVKPLLHAQGVKHIDKLIISHGDNDHAGGLPDVLNNFTVGDVLSSTPAQITNTLPCSQHKWHWDGIDFEILHPQAGSHLTGNNASCVLSIANSDKRILLLSDIEKKAEQDLIESGVNLKADVIQVAHHGSQTSSTKALIDAINPSIAVISNGYKNQYRHPHKSVIDRLKNKDIQVFKTSNSGAIEISFGKEISIHTYRKRFGKFWHQKPVN